ncbi:hypothetical protein L7F22_041990 [Adiantum nelumboides]|nr:hypothetical protein [Adiantum nelumboides]
MSKKDVQVHVYEDNTLEIGTEYKKVEEKSSMAWYVAERSHGQFVWRFQLPENIKVDDVKAVIEDGVLNITVPRKAHYRPVGKKIPL